MTKKLFIFNTEKTNIISVSDYDVDFENNLKSANIPHKVFDIDESHQYYYGTYDSGSIRSTNDHPIIDEVIIDTITNKEILAKYPIHTQLNILADCIERSGIPLTAEFTTMRSWINQKIQNHNESIDVYSNNTNVYSWVPKPLPPTDD